MAWSVRAESRICDVAWCARSSRGGNQTVDERYGCALILRLRRPGQRRRRVLEDLSVFRRVLAGCREQNVDAESRTSGVTLPPACTQATDPRYWCLLIWRRLILDSSVDDEIPRRVAAPVGPNTRPLLSWSACSISRRSLHSIA